MNTIKLEEDFIINDNKVKIISGAVHYFRIVPEYWKDTLLDLIDMGCNCVETYMPWNLHEPVKGKFDYEGIKDVFSFLNLAKNLGLYVILRPSPYICSEWEFGGLPAWLLKEEKINFRTDDPIYLKHVKEYYDDLIPRIKDYQWTNNGPIIMVQLENEYGSFGNNKNYLKKLLQMLKKGGIDVPIFTSDGSWQEALYAGSLIDKEVSIFGNFGSNARENVMELESFKEKNNIKNPIMCMEFWDGWFNKWGQEVIRRDPLEFANSAKEMINLGSINFYMFQGGTNFGFMNGCSARKDIDFPQITSYDYDAILTEAGQKTEKYHLIREIITGKKDKLSNRRNIKKYDSIKINRKVSLFNTIESISRIVKSKDAMTFEQLDYYYGYVLYEHSFIPKTNKLRMRIIDARDRALIYLNNVFQSCQYQDEIGDEIVLDTKVDEKYDLKILIENMGRVNYGHKLKSQTQKKGISSGLILDMHFVEGFKHYCIDFNKIDKIKWEENFDKGPAFYEFILKIDKDCKVQSETYINLEGFGKGIVIVNGFNLGRFFNIGPTLGLYLPGSLLKKGDNQIIIFESEGIYKEELSFNDSQIFKDMNND